MLLGSHILLKKCLFTISLVEPNQLPEDPPFLAFYFHGIGYHQHQQLLICWVPILLAMHCGRIGKIPSVALSYQTLLWSEIDFYKKNYGIKNKKHTYPGDFKRLYSIQTEETEGFSSRIFVRLFGYVWFMASIRISLIGFGFANSVSIFTMFLLKVISSRGEWFHIHV